MGLFGSRSIAPMPGWRYVSEHGQTAKLFRSGRSQAVRLPKVLRFDGNEVYVKRVSGGVVLLSKSDPWAAIVEAYALADPEHPIRRRKPPPQKRSFKWR